MKQTMRITPEGTRDLLFEECLARREMERRITGLFRRRGFCEVMTPGVEFFDVFSAGGAIPPESMYKMTDTKGRLLVMRPDSTTPIARLAATRLRQSTLPHRLYYAQDVYRLHHGLSGRRDQEFQAGVELIGAEGERADLEIITLAAEALLGCTAGDIKLELGHAGFFAALTGGLAVEPDTLQAIRTQIEYKNYAALSELLDTLPPSPETDALRLLPRLFGGEEVLEKAAELCRDSFGTAAMETLSRLYRQLCKLGLSDKVMIDLGMLHPNEYYTGVIFRGYTAGSGETVVSGGRYDALLRQYGLPLPAIGFGVNMDALAKGLLDRGEIAPPDPPEFLIHAADGAETAALEKAAEFAAAGSVTECSVFGLLEQSLAYAAARGIRQVIAVDIDKIEVYEC